MIAAIKRRALHRAKILEGQMRGIHKMIDDEDYCIDILTQCLAVQKSISSLEKLLLENHIRTHVKKDLSTATVKQQEKIIFELLRIYELTTVRGK